MKNLIIIFLFCLGSLAFFNLASDALAATRINHHVQIVDKKLRLGDIFPETAHQQAIIGDAPAPGRSIMMKRNILLSLAKKYDVNWYPSPELTAIKIERLGRELDQAPIIKLIEKKIHQSSHVAFDNMKINLKLNDNNPTLPLHGTANYRVEQFYYSPSTGNFNGIVKISLARDYQIRTNFSGRAILQRAVPTLIEPIQKDQIIRAHHLQMIDKPLTAIGKNTLTDKAQIINMQATQNLRAEQLVYLRNIRAPILVKKRKPVTMIYENHALKIKTQGIAMEDGAMGDVVRAKNSTSQIIVEGIVTSDETITIFKQKRKESRKES